MPSKPFIDIHTHATSHSKHDCIEIINRYPQEESALGKEKDLLFSVGIHPWYIRQNLLETQFQKLDELIALQNVVALGETGLDRLTKAPMTLQKEVFEFHLNLAAKHNKPVIVHTVKSYPDSIQTYKKLGLNLNLIFHGFRGNIIIAKQLINYGFYLSFGKHILDSNNKESEILMDIPLENIFLETDDSEINITDIYARAAQIKAMTIEQLKEALHRNFITCFGNIL